ncbi:hypothetical protein B0H66DRAFT_600240 [Apodospora peruviana]|uniref:Uncharacterized protein n=1 Tax=Apodospora peruviana TaxID=516989 RepID=A0AAE0MBY9_9PEZI|nr:hypothetical protein B0H66DRAFT_600240 [Apodospora peruviana]
MIFNDQPWYNEPGRETHLDKNQCKLYNQQIQQHTVQHAILYWLNNRLSQPGKGKAPAIAAKPLPARPGPKTSGAPSQYPISLLAKQYSQKPSQSGSLTDTPPPGWYEWYEYEHHHGPHPLLPKPLPTDTQFHQSHGGLSQQATGPDSGTFGIGGFGLGAPSKFPPAPQPPPPGTTKYGNAINGSLNNEAGNWDEWHNFKPSSGSLHPPSMKGAGGSAGIHPPSNPVQNDAQMKLKLQQLKLQQQEMLHLQMMYSQQKEIELALGKDIMSTTDAQKMAHDLAGLGGSYYTPLQPPPAPISLDRAPIGNTTVDSNDDYVWGDVVRKHFELRASSIVATAKRWQKEWPKDSKLVSELEETLTKHGFQ